MYSASQSSIHRLTNHAAVPDRCTSAVNPSMLLLLRSALHPPQALRLILSPRGSASALVRHAASRFNNVSRHVGTCCPTVRSTRRQPQSLLCEAASRSCVGCSTPNRHKERRQKLHTTEHAMDARSRECVSAMERPASRGYRPWRGFPCDKVVAGDDFGRLAPVSKLWDGYHRVQDFVFTSRTSKWAGLGRA